MIVTTTLGNTRHDDGAQLIGDRHVEKVALDSADLVKRIQRLETDHGRELGLRLPADAEDLRDGDILYLDDAGERGHAIVVSVLPTEVLVISAQSIVEMAFIAHSLGNRHLQAQFFGADSEYGSEVMVVQDDHTVRDFLDHHQAYYERQQRVMPTPFRHAAHTH
ncbi:urease accessory protein UreE [Citricoccus muralis]|uniref:Urease accessory protein UreE n=1 Tax=Citricoccus muralis TaxID=169134 RepID=A0ABY8H7D4_9MICC|nr:urease accessory protein UreE [Citricoccus muralis]WFP17061.1 urease accessory protein UreE [Citricoccus muralis]